MSKIAAIAKRFAARSETPVPADEDEDKKDTVEQETETEEEENVSEASEGEEDEDEDEGNGDDQESVRAKAYADAGQVITMCQLAGRTMSDASAFIEKGLSPSQVGKALVAKGKTQKGGAIISASQEATNPSPKMSGVQLLARERAAKLQNNSRK